MGMGEPFQNYAETMKFVGIIHDPAGLNFGARRITISTSGIVPRIDALAAGAVPGEPGGLAPCPDRRIAVELVPVNKRWPIAELMAACDRYIERTGRRVSFEYALMNGVNEQRRDRARPRRAAAGRLCHVNVIPFNPVDVLEFERPDPAGIERFAETLRYTGIPTTVRYSRGVEIAAACGQLRAKHQRATA